MPSAGASFCRRSSPVRTRGRLLSSSISRAPVHGPGPGCAHRRPGRPPNQHPQPGTQEIASSTCLPVLVVVHFIEPAFTVGIKSSFQIPEVGDQRLHLLGSTNDQRASVAVRQEPVIGDREKGDRITSLCRWSGLALAGVGRSSSLVMNPPLVVCRAAGRAQARPASRPGSWSAGSRPAGIGAITDPLRKGPETRWAGG